MSLMPTSGLLPADARAALVRAAQTPIPPNDPHARVRAVEAAADWVRTKYPHLFKVNKL